MFFKRKETELKSTTIFRQLILNVVIPVVVALLILSSINYFTTKNLLTESNNVKNYIISDEITHIMELQDLALNLVEEKVDVRMRELSSILVDDIFKNTDSIEFIDLDELRAKIGMNPLFEDIYIINPEGIVINTTFENDLNRNFFDFGEAHKNHLLHVLKGNKFVNERFAVEHSTNRLRKYSYQPTNDNKFIIEIGSYSKKADEIIDFIQITLKNISKKESDILSVDLFIGETNPFCLNKDALIIPEHNDALLEVFQDKDTNTIIEKDSNF